MVERERDWIARARNLLIESVLRKIRNAHSYKDLEIQLYCACAKFGLLYDSNTKDEVKNDILNIEPHDQSFQSFKESLMVKLKEFLKRVIK